MIFLFPLFLIVAVLAKSEFLRRIRDTQDLLLLQGPTADVLGEYDRLTKDLEVSLGDVSKAVVAQVYYKKALVELSLNKMRPAVMDLSRTLELDPLLKPASQKLVSLLIERGDFLEVRERFAEVDYPKEYQEMETWEDVYGQIQPNDFDACLHLLDSQLLPLTPQNPLVYELHLECAKRKAVALLGVDDVTDLFREIVVDYSNLIKLLPQKNLQYYSEFAEYLLFTQRSFQDSWNVVKSCLRIDNDFASCGALSKAFLRLQDILKVLDDYSILYGFLYPQAAEGADLNDERLEALLFDWKAADRFLHNDPIKVPKRDLKNAPKLLKTNYDYLIWRAQVFAKAEFDKPATSLEFTRDLSRLSCEAHVRSTGSSEMCKGIDDGNNLFFPKYVEQIDGFLNSKRYAEAQELLSRFNKNVQKTKFFKERWIIIERLQQQQQQRQHQEQQQRFHQQHRQQQQRQHQQQQQQQPQPDQTKDYYKILDITRDADEKTVRKAYRSQTLKFHPDKYKGNDLTESEIEGKMQEINEAYEILSNKESRETYDRGKSGQQQQHHGGQRSNGGGFQFHFNQDMMGNFMAGNNFQFGNGFKQRGR